MQPCIYFHISLWQVQRFQVHARKAVLGMKFSPEDNRKIPPLRYEWVAQLAKDFPNVAFVLNGGINSIPEIQHLIGKDGLYPQIR